MNIGNKTAVCTRAERMPTAGNAGASKKAIAGRTAARKAYRAKIESLLNKSGDVRLAEVWQGVYPFSIDPAHDLLDRQGIIEDLADFVEVLQPSLDGIKTEYLCRLIEKQAICDSRQSDLPVLPSAAMA